MDMNNHYLSLDRLVAILGGVLGSLTGIGVLVGIIMCFVCRYKIRKGDWVCLKVRPGKYKVVTRRTYEALQAQQQARQGQIQGQNAHSLGPQYGFQGQSNMAYAPPPYEGQGQVSVEGQSQKAEYWAPEKH